jgi:hypothetical protein
MNVLKGTYACQDCQITKIEYKNEGQTNEENGEEVIFDVFLQVNVVIQNDVE